MLLPHFLTIVIPRVGGSPPAPRVVRDNDRNCPCDLNAKRPSFSSREFASCSEYNTLGESRYFNGPDGGVARLNEYYGCCLIPVGFRIPSLHAGKVT